MITHLIKAGLFLLAAFMFSCAEPANKETSASTQGQVPAAGQESVSDEESQPNIVKIAVGSNDHTTLVKALQAADLVTALANNGPFTVFAPTNAAFEALPEGTLEDLLKTENKSKLSDILQHHVTVAVFKTENFSDGQVLGMVDGTNATIHNKNGQHYIDEATIVASVQASNGIVHVIDKVLLPPAK